MSLEKLATQIRQQLLDFETEIAGNAQINSVIRTKLEEAFEELEQLEKEHDMFKKSIANLRKDELEARNQLQSMNESIYKLNRKLRSSNLPGVLNFIWRLLEEATDKNNQVLAALDQEPLDIIEVQQSLTEAKSAVENTIENTKDRKSTRLNSSHVAITYAV